jgi:hypothetical protein
MGYSDAHLCINLQGKPLLPISQVYTVRLSTSFLPSSRKAVRKIVREARFLPRGTA